MAKKKVTLQMIADKAGVSVVTVSNVLSGRKGAGEEVRRQVLALAGELGYELPARAGESEDEGEGDQRLIGVLIAARFVQGIPSFYMDIYRQVAREASARGLLTLLDVVDERRESLLDGPVLFGATQPGGILILGEMNPAFIGRVRSAFQAPVVGVDFYNMDYDMDFIITDGFEGTRQLTDCLICQGVQRIAFLGNPRATASIMDRYMGYVKAMTLAHLTPWEPLPDRESGGYGAGLAFELPDELPEAFVCNCEPAARLLKQKLEERGLKVPEDVSVASFDRMRQESEDGTVWLTYESDEASLVRISVSTLLRRMSGRDVPVGIRMVEGQLRQGNAIWKGGQGV